MSLAAGPGAIVIDVGLAEGRVCAVAIKSSRPIGLGRYLLGRRPDEVPILAEQIFALCGFSHRTAAQFAISAARGEHASEAQLFNAGVGLLAERVGDTLRASVLAWPHGSAAARQLGAAMAHLRQASACAQRLADAARSGTCREERQALLPVAERLGEIIHDLGVPRAHEDGAAAYGFFASMTADVAKEDGFLLCAPDALDAEDDEAVSAALRAGGSAFAALPSLPGRIVETGAFCRHWHEVDRSGNAPAARLAARLVDIGCAKDDLIRMLATGEAETCSLVRAGKLSDRDAYAAVESPRGRLYHRVAFGRDGRVAAYDLLAPTEWNLHPCGPLAACLLGAALGRRDDVGIRISRLAALFDPCVAFRVECNEAGDA